MAAIAITISKFGPSGSFIKANSVLEHARDVMPKRSNEYFFEMKIIWVSIVRVTRNEHATKVVVAALY